VFKKTGTTIVLANDEYGCIEGLVPINVRLESIIGDIPSRNGEIAESRILQRDSRLWLTDGALGIVKFGGRFSLDPLPGEERGDFSSLGGCLMMQHGSLLHRVTALW